MQNLLADWIQIQIRSTTDVPILFVSGAQGIGKSTALKHVEQAYDHRLAVLGLDDFYLTKAARKALSESVDPLFDVRGPPGTHDIGFLVDTLDALRHADANSEIAIPRFDKRIDDRCAADAWSVFKGRPRAILVEGWCIGALPDHSQSAAEPLNAVEAQDRRGAWRRYQEAQLAGPYAELWDRGDAFLHLSAPSFDQVFDWRLQQEATTLGLSPSQLPIEKQDWVRDFIQYYERLTRRMLAGERRRGYVLSVDTARRPTVDRSTAMIVVSDLDGTLLDHENYAFKAALPAMQKLKDTNSTLVLASSKTAAEMAELRRQMGFEHCPAIVENGAGLLEPGQSADPKDDATYQRIRSILGDVPAHLRQKFEGFGDCTTKHVSQLTGLTLEAAERARTRCFSEPGRWSGSPDELDAFLQFIDQHGLVARQGGRFLTLSFGATKADQMFKIVSRFTPAPIVALGDAPNDIEMLESANYAVIIKNSGGTEIPVLNKERAGRVVRTQDEGPAAWNTAVLSLIDELGLETTKR